MGDTILPSYVNGEWWTPTVSDQDGAAAASATEVRDA